MRKRRKAQPEADMQRSLIYHLKTRPAPGLVWFSIPNGGVRSPIEAAIMKGLGVKAGIPDMCFLHSSRAMFLELKASGGEPTQSQVDMMENIRAAGSSAFCAVGIDEAIAALEYWGCLIGRAAIAEQAREKVAA